jgi:hypothetical protein
MSAWQSFKSAPMKWWQDHKSQIYNTWQLGKQVLNNPWVKAVITGLKAYPTTAPIVAGAEQVGKLADRLLENLARPAPRPAADVQENPYAD